MKRLAAFLTFCALAALPAIAQQSHFTGQIGGGFSEPVYDIGNRLNTGWNVTGGVGANFNPRFGLMLDVMFNDFDINRTTLNNLAVPNGTTRTWGFTLDPVVHLNPEGATDVYLTGGGGIYHRTVEFTQPAVATVGVFDPFFGVFPVNVDTNQVIGSYSNVKGGLDAGAGVAFRLGSSHARLFAEAKFHYIYTRPTATTIVPVTFGIRW